MNEPLTPAGPRRLWIPALLIVAQAACLMLPYTIEFENFGVMIGLLMFGPMIASAAILLWWVLLSGLSWTDRLVVPLLFAGLGTGAFFLSDDSFKLAIGFYGLASLTTLWVGYLLLTAWLNWPARRIGLVLTVFLAAAFCTLLRLDGTYGNFILQIGYRFAETAEDRYVRERANEAGGVASASAEQLKEAPGDWTGFRGARRDGHAAGVKIATDWGQNPPKELWKQRIGPGWSSFAVVGNRLFTQEQRGPKEVVVCLDADTGKQVWEHSDEARFTEPIAGPGPRATPTFHAGKLYALGAKGTLNCLDAATGKKVWARNIAEDSGSKPPQEWWGYSASPLVAGGMVIVAVSFTEGKSALAYKADTGDLAWSAGDGKNTYSSAHPFTYGGVEQVLVPTDVGLTALDPATGKVLWQHEWKTADGMPRCTQPTVVGDGDIVLASGLMDGSRRLKLRPSGDGVTSEEVWTSRAISPYFNDLVVHNGNIYGFDKDFFTCVSLETGERIWRARGYGQGQVLLLPEQGLLVVLGEKGDVALLKADADKHTVLGKFKAINGKTWNHPVIAQGKLFVRNGEEIACYQLTPKGS